MKHLKFVTYIYHHLTIHLLFLSKKFIRQIKVLSLQICILKLVGNISIIDVYLFDQFKSIQWDLGSCIILLGYMRLICVKFLYVCFWVVMQVDRVALYIGMLQDIIYLNLNQKCIINSNANESLACNKQIFLSAFNWTENIKTFYDPFLDFRA